MRNPRCGGHSVPLRHSSLFPHLQTLDHAPLRRRYRMLDDTNITNDSENNEFGRKFLGAMAAFRREGPFSSLPLSSAAGLSARGYAAASGFGEEAENRERRKGLAENPRPEGAGRGCWIHAGGEDGSAGRTSWHGPAQGPQALFRGRKKTGAVRKVHGSRFFLRRSGPNYSIGRTRISAMPSVSRTRRSMSVFSSTSP